ncbi:MAG: phosphatidate cytidylyltransferase [Bacteroides sp.]|nr:phosphatidate cytidylyltransferase [Bacteroides sp.]
MDIKKLSVRTASGLVYIGIIIGCIFWGIIPFSFMAAVFATLGIIEFEKITHELTIKTIPTLLLDIAGAVCLVFGWMLYPIFIWIFILICRMTLQLYIRSESPLADLSKSMMAQLYIGLPLGIMTLIGEWVSLPIVFTIFLMIWINDTGAFLVGSTLGKHRLFERISPKKSWEGFFGGLIFNIIAGGVFCTYASSFLGMNGMNIYEGIGLGIVVTVFGTWGDLIESMIKRNLQIKDSGNIIPGHGGILDRIDSLLLVMPATFIYMCLLDFI